MAQRWISAPGESQFLLLLLMWWQVEVIVFRLESASDVDASLL